MRKIKVGTVGESEVSRKADAVRKEIDGLLAELGREVALADDADDYGWGHLGSLQHVAAKLRELVVFAKGEG